MHISPAECRAARALLNWSLDELSRRSGVERTTIYRFEREKQTARPANQAKLRRALANGVEFGEDGWIRLRLTEAPD